MAFATTVTYNWLVDGTNYAQTTCEIGNDLILPIPTPTKYGYHFVGWVESTMFGHWEQNGTPTPQNPIEPTFTQFGTTVLRAVGTGNKLIADSYDPQTRKILRRIGVKVLNGTEEYGDDTRNIYTNCSGRKENAQPVLSTHFTNEQIIKFMTINIGWSKSFLSSINLPDNSTDLAQYITQQYLNGTPIVIYYPLATPVEEDPQ